MLTFTNSINVLNGHEDIHTYSLIGSVVDHEDSIVYAAETSGNLARIMRSLQYYTTDFENVVVQYLTVYE
jgi:hypothetical protein